MWSKSIRTGTSHESETIPLTHKLCLLENLQGKYRTLGTTTTESTNTGTPGMALKSLTDLAIREPLQSLKHWAWTLYKLCHPCSIW